MPPIFTKLLAERLSARSALRVEEAEPGVELHPGTAWLAPGDKHLVVVQDRDRAKLWLNHDPPENGCRPSADQLFRSVAQVFGARSLAVILTGMGQDGLRGCESLREVGARVIAQDEATSVVWGMPGAVAKAGLAEKVLPIDKIAAEIVRKVQKGRAALTLRSRPNTDGAKTGA